MAKLSKPLIIKQRERLCKVIKGLDKQRVLADKLGCTQANISIMLKTGSLTVTELMILIHNYPEYADDIFRELKY